MVAMHQEGRKAIVVLFGGCHEAGDLSFVAPSESSLPFPLS